MKEYWNTLFKNRDKEFDYEPYLEDDIKLLKKGKLLDVGAGDGRNSFYFVEKDFKVSCLDYSEEGLSRIKLKSEKLGLNIETIKCDVFKDDFDNLYGSFNSVVLIHFFPDISVLKKLVKLLSEHGRLYCNTFIKDNLDKSSSKYNIGISNEEISEIKKQHNVVKELYREDPRGEFYTFIIE